MRYASTRRAPINGVQIVPVGAMSTAWNLSGNISPASGGNGAMVTLTGTVSATTTADASGNYVFTGLPSGSYAVTPVRNSDTLLQAWATPRTGLTTNKVGPYPASASAASPGNCCTQQGNTTESWIQLGSLYQIRQTGSITSIRFGWGTAPSGSVTGLYFTVWRWNSAGTFDRVAESQNLAGSVSSGSVNTIGLTPPLAVRDGDYYGMRQVGSLPSNHLNIVNATLGNLFYTTATPSSPYDWLSHASMGVGQSVIVDMYMSTGPNFVTPSDSWFSGKPDSFSGCDTVAGGIWNPASNVGVTIAHYLADKLATQTGLAFTFDNCSITGDPIVNTATRYGSDALAAGPRFAVLAGGWNDIWHPYTQSQFHAAWNSILAANQAAGITSIVMLLQPVTSATNAEHPTADAWNADLKALVQNSYPSAILVDVAPYLGQFRPGGPAGNLWDIQAVYDAGDLTHPNPAGKARVAQAIDDAIVAYASVIYTFSPVSRSVTISGADVAGINFAAVSGS